MVKVLKIYSILYVSSKKLKVFHLVLKVHNHYNIKLFPSNVINIHN